MKKIYYILVFIAMVAFVSCNDWLDVQPKDKMLEDKQFSTEENIHSALNGLYREMVNEHLYGGQLSQTTVEVMGHFYTYPLEQPSIGDYSLPFFLLANFRYADDNVKSRFADIWRNAYSVLLHINIYIKNLEESKAVMSERDKKILLGEAYGLRAYLHFDVFRMFGPVYQNRNGNKALPYNNKTEVVLNHPGYEEAEYRTADEYVDLLLQDIKKAETLLDGNDPIQSEPDMITNKLLGDNFFQNRNRRMNYYALKGLEARVKQYIGDDVSAAAVAKIITDKAETGIAFKWVSPTTFAKDFNYLLFSEVIFGINNMDRYSRAVNWYDGTDLRSSYLVDYNNLMDNILGYGGSSILSEILDVRSKQWKASNALPGIASYSIKGTYKSDRYKKITKDDLTAFNDFQPLMRLSEMYYIQAEVALKTEKEKARNLLNKVLEYKGLTQQYFLTEQNSPTEIEIRAHIEKEYYREFFGEGQVFFYHKRLRNTRMFKGNDSGHVENIAVDSYVVPIPQIETDI